MNILFINNFFVGFMVFEIQRVSVFGYFPLYIYLYYINNINIINLIIVYLLL